MRTAILIDGSNNFMAMRSLKFEMDYDKLLALPEFTYAYAYYFTALRDKEKDSPLQKLVDYLQYNKWNVIHKPTSEYDNPGGKPKIKGNMDCELILTAVDLVLQADVKHIALFSGDGDFTELVKWLQKRGVWVSVYSTLVSDPPMIADTLRRQCNNFIELNEFKSKVTRVEGAPFVERARPTFLKKRAV